MGLLGHEPDEPTEETKLLWGRGKLDETWVVERLLVPEFGFDNIIRQKAVEWPRANGSLPIGELHGDAFVVSEGMPVEIKSRADGEPIDSDFTQLAGAIHFDPDAGDVGTLIVVDRNLGRQMIPVKLTPERVEEVETIAHDVVEAGKTGELPARVCSHPGEGIGRFCPFIAQCFAGWVAPAPQEVATDQAELLAAAFRLQEQIRVTKAPVGPLEDELKTIKAALTDLPVAAGVELRGGGVLAKRADIADRESMSLTEARKAGIFTPADEVRFGPFIKQVGGHSRWTLKRDQAAPLLAEDFGDDAPWTDEDLETPDLFASQKNPS